MTTRVFTTRKISFESATGGLTLTLEDRGFSLRAESEATDGLPANIITFDHVPLPLAAEIRDFLIYALRGYTAEELT